MAKCRFCGDDIPQPKYLKHCWTDHREEMLEQSRRASPFRKRGDGSAPPKNGAKQLAGEGLSTSETALVKLVSQAQVVLMTPDIFVGYMCAVQRGFGGSLTDWLSLASRDFWIGRQVDLYREVSGVANAEGLRLGQGAGGEDYQSA